MVEVEDANQFLMEIAFMNGFIMALDKESRLPQLDAINKVANQLRGQK